MNPHILTAGSGPSYTKWSFWPTWNKLLALTHKCKVTDVSAPAAGNKFISRSVITQIANFTPELVLVQWNLGKYDVYSESREFLNMIINSNSERNFIVDLHTSKTTTGPGYWCSSYDNTIPWKKYYNENIKSDIGTALDDLEAMLNVQNLCVRKNIPYKFFLHDDINSAKLIANKNTAPFYNEIDWNCNILDHSLSRLYKNHESYTRHVAVPGHGAAVPNAEFQWWLLTEKISANLNIDKKSNWQNISDYCKTIALKNYNEYKNS